jgi:HEAT repeat protein
MKLAHSPEIQMEPTFTPTSQDKLADQGQTLADALDAIGRGSFHASNLRALTDLSREQTAEVARRWNNFPEESRVRIVQELQELAEESVELSFTRVLHLALFDDSPRVRQVTIDALWEDLSSELRERLLHLAQSDSSQDVRAAAAQGLAKFADASLTDDNGVEIRDEIWNRLYEIAKDQAEPYMVRRRALESVAVFGNRREVTALIRDAYDADDPGYHAGALYAMGRTLDPRWLDTLIMELESEDAEMRYEAARAAGEIGDVKAIPGLAVAATDEDSEVRNQAILALGRIGGRGAERVLRNLAESASPADQDAIAEALDVASDELA